MFAEGLDESRAQSRGECPGARAICLEGFCGLARRVGGGKREDEDGGPRFGRGPEGAGGRVDEPGWRGRSRDAGTGRGGGAMSPEKVGGFSRGGAAPFEKEEEEDKLVLGSGMERENCGTASASSCTAEALGVVCSSKPESGDLGLPRAVSSSSFSSSVASWMTGGRAGGGIVNRSVSALADSRRNVIPSPAPADMSFIAVLSPRAGRRRGSDSSSSGSCIKGG